MTTLNNGAAMFCAASRENTDMSEIQEKIEIIEKKSYACPFCGRAYATEKEAQTCMASGQWLQDFKDESVLWRWVILGNTYGNVCAYIPRKIERKYHWVAGAECIRRCISLFNAFSSSYINATPSDTEYYGEYRILETLGIAEGYEKYKLVPPVRYIRHEQDIPDNVRSEAEKVLKKAYQVRKKELRQITNGNQDILEDILIAFINPDLAPDPELAKLLKETELVLDSDLMRLEWCVPAFKKK